VKKD
jgi:hypothetical protein